jgi:hypothetical protein
MWITGFRAGVWRISDGGKTRASNRRSVKHKHLFGFADIIKALPKKGCMLSTTFTDLLEASGRFTTFRFLLFSWWITEATRIRTTTGCQHKSGKGEHHTQFGDFHANQFDD